METIYDWATVAAFTGLIVLFLQRSTLPEPPDTIWHYMPPAIACAIANQLGNTGYGVVAVLILVGVAVYFVRILKVQLPGAR